MRTMYVRMRSAQPKLAQGCVISLFGVWSFLQLQSGLAAQ